MQIPPTPPDETTRLASLHALGLLDTHPEERFDRLTRVASRLFDVPIALVSLVDANRQWFKSIVGLEVSETPREVSFCGHTILGPDILVIEDATADPRFCSNPLVTGDPHIRFYAGYPLTAPTGGRVGTLCIIDQAPRQFDERDRQLLEDLALMAMQELTGVEHATTDVQTGISNRNGFSLLANHTVQLCGSLGRPVSMLSLELDPSPGTDGPDAARLSAFAHILVQSFLHCDVVGRVGEHEFAVLMGQGGDSRFAAALAELQRGVDEYNAGQPIGSGLSYSLGTAVGDPTGYTNLTELFHAAAADLRSNKRKRESEPSVAV